MPSIRDVSIGVKASVPPALAGGTVFNTRRKKNPPANAGGTDLMTPPRAASRLWQFITMLRDFILLAFIAGAPVPGSAAPLTQRAIRIAVVDFGAGATGQRVAGQ